MPESFVHASNHCGRFRSGNPKPRRSTLNWKPPPLHVALAQQQSLNLNPNRRYTPACDRTMRTYACGQGGQTAAAKRAIAIRQARTGPLCVQTAWVKFDQACEFAEVLYYAFLHARARGSPVVMSQLARGLRFTLAPEGRDVIGEQPRANVRYSTCLCNAEILAALPGACRAASRCQQRQIQEAVAHWWLKPTCALAALAGIEPQESNEVPLDTSVVDCCLKLNPTRCAQAAQSRQEAVEA